MKRLTYFDGGKWRLKIGDTEYSGEAVDRLAAYEETDLEPEEVEQIKKAAAYMMFEDVAHFVRYTLSNFDELQKYKELGDYNRLRELKQADDEGLCVVLPCKILDKVWDVIAHYQFEITEIDILPYGKILFRCGNKGTDDYVEFYDEDLGDTFIFEEPPKRDSHIDAEAALRREQDG